MNQQEIDKLFLEKKHKGISNKELAHKIGCSESLLSMFFNGKCNLSEDKQNLLKKIIKETVKYKLVKIE